MYCLLYILGPLNNACHVAGVQRRKKGRTEAERKKRRKGGRVGNEGNKEGRLRKGKVERREENIKLFFSSMHKLDRIHENRRPNFSY